MNRGRHPRSLLFVLGAVLLFHTLKVKQDTNVEPQQFEPHRLVRKAALIIGHHDSLHHLTGVITESRLEKREDEHFYDEAVCKGEQALNKILNNPPSTRVYTQQDQIDAWAPTQRRGGVSPELYPALRDLNIPYDQDTVRGVATFQSKLISISNDQIHPQTNGAFDNLFIPAGRESAIIAVNNHSPKAYAVPGSPLPALHRWSDVVWQNWTAITGNNARQLRFVIHQDVFTSPTRKVMEYIEVAEKDKLDLPWPGQTYDMRSDDGKALLGTVHGLGVAWLIIDHSDVLGRKIPAIRIFTVVTR
ncbi:MAG: hypothetical protein Q9209_005686 [Squamulea sp. 1 TL-2023]